MKVGDVTVSFKRPAAGGVVGGAGGVGVGRGWGAGVGSYSYWHDGWKGMCYCKVVWR